MNPLLKLALEVDRMEHLVLSSLTREKKENAIFAKFPADSKSGKGADRKLLLLGPTATLLGKKEYSRSKLVDLSDDDVDKLYNRLVK